MYYWLCCGPKLLKKKKMYAKHTFLKSLYHVEYDSTSYYVRPKVAKRNNDNENFQQKKWRFKKVKKGLLYSFILHILVSKTMISFCEIFLFYPG